MDKAVIYVVESGGISGGVRVIFEHLNHLRARGWHVEVYSLDSNRPAWFPLNPSIPWVRFDKYDNLIRALLERDAVKVATWWKTAHPVAEASKSGEGFYLVQDIETHYYLSPIEQEAVMRTYELPLRRFTNSQWIADNLPDTYRLGIGIDLNTFYLRDTPRQINSLLSCGRAQELKGWSTLCETYRLLYHAQKVDLWSFSNMGIHPPFSKPLPTKMTDAELVRWYNRMGLFLSTSIHEGFSLTLMEAMACGAVVITTDADANMEFCQDDYNCVIIPKGNAQAIVNNVASLLDDTERLMRLQKGGIDTALQWPWEPVIDRLEAFYRG